MECRKFDCGKTHCGACCGGACHRGELFLTAAELELLRRFAALAFLPVARRREEDVPFYLEDGVAAEEMGAAILGLRQKGLICVDYDIPLQNFDYKEYEAYPMHGSMALTASGQRAVESLDIQGLEP